MTPAIDVRDAFRIYRSQAGGTVALQGLTLTVEPGEVVVVLGPSGSGKTTLLRVLSGLEHLSAGNAHVLGVDLSLLDAGAAAAFRAARLGLLDQHYARSLSPDLTCARTIALQLELLGAGPQESRARADALLAHVGLADRADERPVNLSGGEQQRVAVCAAVAHRPELLLADEPAGELDADNAAVVYELLGQLVRASGASALIVSHDAAAASIADRLVSIRDGRLVEQAEPGRPPSLVVGRGGWVRLPDALLAEVGRPRFLTAERLGDLLALRPQTSIGEPHEEAVTRPLAKPRLARQPDASAELLEVTKSYEPGDGDRVVLERLTWAFRSSAFTAVVGPSGSGKTTLLHLLAGLERPTVGEVAVLGTKLGRLDRARLADLRRRHVALVTQEPGLVPYLSSLENVELGLTLRGSGGDLARKAREALVEVGLEERLHLHAARLSAGERQRVAIARALAAEVELLLVDEPTARLDEENARLAGHLLARAAHEYGLAVVAATHDAVLIELADDVLPLDSTAPESAALLSVVP